MSNNSVETCRTLSQLLSYGHELYKLNSYQTCAQCGLDRAQVIVNFRTATLFELQPQLRLRAQFAQTELHPHSELVRAQGQLLKKISPQNAPQIVPATAVPPELARSGGTQVVLFLQRPGAVDFPWAVVAEFAAPPPSAVLNTWQLVGTAWAEALSFFAHSSGAVPGKRKHRQWQWYLIGLIVIIALLCYPFRETVTAPFTLIPAQSAVAYAPFDGIIDRTLLPGGTQVKIGEPILRYDPARFLFQLFEAQSARREAEQELLLERQHSFTDAQKLGKIQLLEAHLKTLQIAENQAQWYVDRLTLTAPATGILHYQVPRRELLHGKRVQRGEQLFEILSSATPRAEIAVPETQGAILDNLHDIELFLHTAPEQSIPGKALQIALFPELTPADNYVFKIQVALPEKFGNWRYGMRGTARLYGSRVPWGYSLFKSFCLYWRNW